MIISCHMPVNINAYLVHAKLLSLVESTIPNVSINNPAKSSFIGSYFLVRLHYRGVYTIRNVINKLFYVCSSHTT